MLYRKKISYDVLHVALILVFMRIGPDTLLSNPLHDILGTTDVFVGPAVAYQLYDSRDSLMGSSRYETLKNMNSHFVDESTILHDRLNYFSHRSRQNVIAYYSDRPDTHKKQEEQEVIHENSHNSVDGEILSSNNSTVHDFSDSSTGQALNTVNIDLSREDMNLIEILWKQDIDLGISREAFSFFDTQNTDKTKTKAKLSGCSQDFHEEENEIDSKNDCNEDISFYKRWEGLCFTIDSETGEHSISEGIPNQTLSYSQTNNNLISTRCLEDSSLQIITSERNQVSSAETFVGVRENEQPFEVTFSSVSECIFEDEAEKFDAFVQRSEEFPQIGEEMYPSLEEYWQDISNTLPLSVTGIASYQPNLSRMNRMFSDVGDRYGDNEIYISSEIIQHPLVPDGYVETLFHNASLGHRHQDMNTNFSYMNAADSTSLGCAVASSIATLTNDSDPVPDVCSNLNSTYGLDFVSIFHTNNTSTASPNDSFMSQILSEEELQFLPEEGAVGESVSKMFTEEVDLDNDSISSATPGDTSSFSDSKCTSIKKCANVAGTEYGKKESHCTSSKYSYDQSSYIDADGSSQNSNFDLTSPSHNRFNYSYYLQHNHSYHLSFFDGSNLAKAMTRDRNQNSRSDEEHGRDEKRAKALNLPISIDEIINLAIDEFNEKLSKFELTEPQLTLIRDIRRRGKNKVAAQNCRKRKMDQICSLQQDLDLLQAERMQLENERMELLNQRQNIHDKYSHLCHLIFKNPSNSAFIEDVLHSTQESESFCDNYSTNSINYKTRDQERELVIQGVRAKRKLNKKKF